MTNRRIPNRRSLCPGLFKELQAQFLHQLRTCPDQYNCDLERQVCRLRPPAQTRDSQHAGDAPLEAFTKLLELIQKYVFSCVLAQLAFSCPEAPDCSCVLIGSVEVENGRLTRVLNYPRWYLWCFGNFFEVLLYTMANDGACGKDATAQNPNAKEDGSGGRSRPAVALASTKLMIDQFLNLFSADHRAFEKAARTSVDAIQASYSALVAGFNFTRPGGIAPAVLHNLDRTKAEGLTSMLGLNFEPFDWAGSRTSAMSSQRLRTIRFAFVPKHWSTTPTSQKTASGNTVSQVNGVIGAPAFAVGSFTHSMFTDLLERLTIAEARLSACEKASSVSNRESPAPRSTSNPLCLHKERNQEARSEHNRPHSLLRWRIPPRF